MTADTVVKMLKKIASQYESYAYAFDHGGIKQAARHMYSTGVAYQKAVEAMHMDIDTWTTDERRDVLRAWDRAVTEKIDCDRAWKRQGFRTT